MGAKFPIGHGWDGSMSVTHCATYSIPGSGPNICKHLYMNKFVDQKRLDCHADHQEVSRCHTRSESGKSIAHRWWRMQELYPDFETQGRRQKFKTGVSVAPQKGLLSFNFFKETWTDGVTPTKEEKAAWSCTWSPLEITTFPGIPVQEELVSVTILFSPSSVTEYTAPRDAHTLTLRLNSLTMLIFISHLIIIEWKELITMNLMYDVPMGFAHIMNRLMF